MVDGSRPLRADAVRNRAKILDAARAEIAAHGVDVGMDAIARAAGVAVGTLYRHFPTKTDLVAAVVAQYVVAIAEEAEASLARALRGESRAVDEVVGYLRRVTESSADHVAVKAAARTLGVDAHGDKSAETRIGAALADLLTQGQEAGSIRATVSVEDLFLLMSTAPFDQPEEVRDRWVDLVVPGLIP